eukprot:3939016-Rhodomonas_salina.3
MIGRACFLDSQSLSLPAQLLCGLRWEVLEEGDHHQWLVWEGCDGEAGWSHSTVFVAAANEQAEVAKRLIAAKCSVHQADDVRALSVRLDSGRSDAC